MLQSRRRTALCLLALLCTTSFQPKGKLQLQDTGKTCITLTQKDTTLHITASEILAYSSGDYHFPVGMRLVCKNKEKQPIAILNAKEVHFTADSQCYTGEEVHIQLMQKNKKTLIATAEQLCWAADTHAIYTPDGVKIKCKGDELAMEGGLQSDSDTPHRCIITQVKGTFTETK